MATAPTIPEIVLPPQQTIAFPREETPRNRGGFIIGESDRPQDDRIVAITIGLRANFRINDREFSGPLCAHEYIPMRRFYEDQNGSITLEPGWVAGVFRHRQLTQAQLVAEVTRMNSAFAIPRENGVTDVMGIYYGAEPAGRVRKIHEIMRKQAEAWSKLVPVLHARAKPKDGHALVVWNGLPSEVQLAHAYDTITTQELNAIVNLADPGMDLVGDLVLDTVSLSSFQGGLPAPDAPPVDIAATQAAAEAEADASQSGLDVLVDKLAAAGLPPSSALEVASMVEMMGPGATIGDNDLTVALGSASKAKLAAVREVLKQHKG